MAYFLQKLELKNANTLTDKLPVTGLKKLLHWLLSRALTFLVKENYNI